MGFIPSQNGIIYDQPVEVIEFIRFYFIAIPVLFTILSFYLKFSFPIDSELKMLRLKTAISLQKEKVELLKERCDLYSIKDPIYNDRYLIHIFVKNEMQAKSKIVSDHFYSKEYINLLIQGKYQDIKRKLIGLIIIWGSIFSFFLGILFLTFKYLSGNSLSLIPLISLFVVTFALCFIILNSIRLNVINKVISEQYIMDINYLKLVLFKIKKNVDEEDIEKEGLW